MRAITFLVFGILLMLSLNLEVEGLCKTNGCSIPFNWPYFYKTRFTPACNKHDVCYACGVRNRWSRYRCDVAFYRDMLKLCKNVANFFQRISCRGVAFDYYRGVRLFGWKHYENPSLSWCPSCPTSNGDPFKTLGR